MIIGSCYELSLVDGQWEYECSLTTQNLCSGYWVAPVNENNSYCTSSFRPATPIISGSYIVPQTMGLTTFEAYGLTSGDEFQGGIYIGIFKPSYLNGVSSKVRGNLSFEAPKYNNFTTDSIGGTYSKWAIIVDFNLYNVSFLNNDEKDIYVNTSVWDGYYNTHGNNSTFAGINTTLSRSLKAVPRKGFIDYYLPSFYELAFFAEYLFKNSINLNASLLSSSIFNTKYLNLATNKNKIKGNSFIYGQNMKSGSKQYRTVLINKYNKHYALFFRRIVLT